MIDSEPPDQYEPTMSPIKFQLERLHTMLYWISEHALTIRDLGPLGSDAAEELNYLLDSVEQGKAHWQRLKQHLEAGDQL